MLLLAIDTASTTSVAVVRGEPTGAADSAGAGQVLAERTTDSTTDHAERLSGAVAAVLAEAGVTPEQLSAIIVGVGPGPFTGLRIGMVAAAAYGYGWDKPVHGVMSLDALALTANQQLPAQTDFLVAADARRREVYWAHYRSRQAPQQPQLIDGPGVGAAAEIPQQLRTLPAFGPGVQLYPEAFGNVPGPAASQAGPVEQHGPAGYLGLRGAAYLAAAPEELLPLEPLYLRESDAKLPTDKKWARNA